MIQFTAKLQKDPKPGGWTYVVVSAARAKKLTAAKKSFRVKGTLDNFAIQKTALLAMGNGDFLLPVNARMRKGVGKKAGEKVLLTLERDERKHTLSRDLLQCLKEAPDAAQYFKSLPPSQQYFYSNWISQAKSAHTKARRLVAIVNSMAQQLRYHEVMEVYQQTVL